MPRRGVILRRFLPNFHDLWAASCSIRCYNLGGFAPGVSGFIGFTFRGVCVTPHFQRPLAAKLCVGGEHVLEVQERLVGCVAQWYNVGL